MKHPWIVSVELELELVPVAEAAYEAFREMERRAVKHSLPPWQRLPAHRRQAWEEAVMTALRKVTSSTLEVGNGVDES